MAKLFVVCTPCTPTIDYLMIRQAEQGSRNQLHDKMLIKGHKHAPCNLKIAGYITANYEAMNPTKF